MFYLSLAVVGFTIAAVTVAGNTALLLTIFRDTRRLLQTPPSLLIANLCVSDLMVGLITGKPRGTKRCLPPSEFTSARRPGSDDSPYSRFVFICQQRNHHRIVVRSIHGYNAPL